MHINRQLAVDLPLPMPPVRPRTRIMKYTSPIREWMIPSILSMRELLFHTLLLFQHHFLLIAKSEWLLLLSLYYHSTITPIPTPLAKSEWLSLYYYSTITPIPTPLLTYKWLLLYYHSYSIHLHQYYKVFQSLLFQSLILHIS
jgi:hypothetical protein